MNYLVGISCMLFSFFGNVNAPSDANTFEALKTLEGEWVGILNKTNGSSVKFTLKYSVRAAGSALLEESDEDGMEMLTIFNLQNNRLHSTHYCGLQNKPVGTLQSNKAGVISIQTDVNTSGLAAGKDTYVDSWELNLLPNDKDTFEYKYIVKGPEGLQIIATATMKRAK